MRPSERMSECDVRADDCSAAESSSSIVRIFIPAQAGLGRCLYQEVLPAMPDFRIADASGEICPLEKVRMPGLTSLPAIIADSVISTAICGRRFTHVRFVRANRAGSEEIHACRLRRTPWRRGPLNPLRPHIPRSVIFCTAWV